MTHTQHILPGHLQHGAQHAPSGSHNTLQVTVTSIYRCANTARRPSGLARGAVGQLSLNSQEPRGQSTGEHALARGPWRPRGSCSSASTCGAASLGPLCHHMPQCSQLHPGNRMPRMSRFAQSTCYTAHAHEQHYQRFLRQGTNLQAGTGAQLGPRGVPSLQNVRWSHSSLLFSRRKNVSLFPSCLESLLMVHLGCSAHRGCPPRLSLLLPSGFLLGPTCFFHRKVPGCPLPAVLRHAHRSLRTFGAGLWPGWSIYFSEP